MTSLVLRFTDFVLESKTGSKNAESYVMQTALRRIGITQKEGLTCTEVIVDTLLDKGEMSAGELTKFIEHGVFNRTFDTGNPQNHKTWNWNTIGSSVDRLVAKGIVQQVRKRNPMTNRMSYFYAISPEWKQKLEGQYNIEN